METSTPAGQTLIDFFGPIRATQLQAGRRVGPGSVFYCARRKPRNPAVAAAVGGEVPCRTNRTVARVGPGERRQTAGIQVARALGEPLIRPYKESDCDAIIDVWFAASLLATPFLSEEFLAAERESIRSIWLQKADTWVFVEDGQVVGFLSLVGNEVGAIFVHPEAQGQGIGRALMDHAAGLHDELFLDVFEANAVGRRFYDRYGFKFERKHFHEVSGHMQLRLSYKAD